MIYNTFDDALVIL